MTWEDLFNCICNNAASGPGWQDVLRALERHTICTGTRCFEEEADLFGTPQNGQAEGGNTGMFFAFLFMLMAAATLLHVNRPAPAITNKSGEGPSNQDDEPPAVQ